MITLKELSEASGIQEIAPGRTIGEQVYDANINTVSQDTDLGSDTYTGSIAPYSDNVDPFFSGLMQVTQPLRNTFDKYGPKIMGGLFGLASGIPGVGLLMNAVRPDPYAQNRIDMYGAYRGSDGFIKDKFGYNVGSTLFKNNFMQPGSNSYRSYALEGLRSLDPVVANNYYQDVYGLSLNDVKSAIQQKEDPFGSAGIIDMGADYQGGGNNENQSFNEGPVGNNAGGAQLGSGMSTGQHAAFRN
tara:strand:- start:126 stop:857 length:732 start_codon:yes stop_codon:yes gene_type:complete